jgi:hypothetical protein
MTAPVLSSLPVRTRRSEKDQAGENAGTTSNTTVVILYIRAHRPVSLRTVKDWIISIQLLAWGQSRKVFS